MGNKNQSKDKDTDGDVSVASKVMKAVGLGVGETPDAVKANTPAEEGDTTNKPKVEVPLAKPATMPKNMRKILNGATRKDN